MHFATTAISIIAAVSTVTAAGDGWCATGFKNTGCDASNQGQAFSACQSDTGCFGVGDATIKSILFSDMKGYKAHYYQDANCGGPTWDAGGGVCRTADYGNGDTFVAIKSFKVSSITSNKPTRWKRCFDNSLPGLQGLRLVHLGCDTLRCALRNNSQLLHHCMMLDAIVDFLLWRLLRSIQISVVIFSVCQSSLCCGIQGLV